jgi:oligopeptide/dipeptide ABC transporter ATP-binding protein
MDNLKKKESKSILLQIRNLSVDYQTRVGWVSAVDRVSMDIKAGEIIGLVGESGSGKSTLGKALMKLLPGNARTEGEIFLEGEDLLSYEEEKIRDLRGRRISMIFQDPMTSLNPVQRIIAHLLETLDVHDATTDVDADNERIAGLMEQLGIQKERITDYPHQLSGGMRQRVMIGLGLVLFSRIVIADEATTSLDVIVEAKLLDQLRTIRDEFDITVLLITHNIALIAEVADRVAVMYAGEIVELGSVFDVFDNPLHPYTQGLLKSVPNIQIDDESDLYRMAGEPPSLINPPTGCRFHPRCPHVMPICKKIEPVFENATPDQWVQCWLYKDHPEKDEPTLVVN